ncbi:MAG: hypothetical protein ACOC5H_02690 [Desulfovermiculus sp.]
MQQTPISQSREELPLWRANVTVFLISAAIIALELALMRWLSVTTWYHFAYLVISTALLGFGASGTFLTLVGRRMLPQFRSWIFWLLLAFALSAVLFCRFGRIIPLNPQYLLYSLEQAAWAGVYHLFVILPFFFGGMIIGLFLMRFKDRVYSVYGANLIGSGIGGALITACMFACDLPDLVYIVAATAILAAFISGPGGERPTNGRRFLEPKAFLPLLLILYLGVDWTLFPMSINVDPYKPLATMKRWEAQGDARHVLTRNGPRARIDVYSSPRLHQTLFAGLTAKAPPPEQMMILEDASPTGVVYRINRPEQAGILDHTPMSVAYRMMEKPRVLLLDEVGGTNVWLAKRFGAAHITVVQRNPQLIHIMQEALSDRNGDVFSLPDVTVVNADPRNFLHQNTKKFDIIHLGGTEALSAASGGTRSLHENYLLTNEGFQLCLNSLSPNGLLTATTGTQTPPRDSIKLLATATEALEDLGTAEPSSHLALFSNYLAATVLASKNRFSSDMGRKLTKACNALRLDRQWHPLADRKEKDQQIHTDAGQDGSYLQDAAAMLFSDHRDQLYDQWVYNIRPATDQSPYFHNFFKWESLSFFINTYGKRWLQKLELGYVILVITILEVIILGGILILLPLAKLQRVSSAQKGKLATLIYFLCLGLAFMSLEMVLILHLNRFLGDPMYSAMGVITAFLVFSGLGSLAGQGRRLQPGQRIWLGVGGISCYMLLYWLFADTVLSELALFPPLTRITLVISAIAPLAFCMGWPFPSGISILRQSAPDLIPWGWGINGFASVAAPPAAVLLATAWGFPQVLGLGVGLYLAAALASMFMPGRISH